MNGTALQVQEIEYWEHCFPEDIIKALYWAKFDTTSSPEHQALRLEGIARVTLTAALNRPLTATGPSPEEIEIRKVLKEIADDLVIIHDKVGIMGYLHLPAKMPMAIIDLRVPMGVLCYPVVSALYLHELGKHAHLLKHYKGFC